MSTHCEVTTAFIGVKSAAGDTLVSTHCEVTAAFIGVMSAVGIGEYTL